MSRIGKKVLALPDGVELNVQGGEIVVKGKKGTLKEPLPAGIEVKKDGKSISITRTSNERTVRALHGTVRNKVANMMKGVSEGFQRRLSIVGVGFKAEVKGKTLNLSLGFSHGIEFPIPEGVQISCEKNQTLIAVAGCDRKQVGEVAACIRRFRPPEPYKGKGVMYENEKIRRKVGKAGGK